jgi:hypothetical protein
LKTEFSQTGGARLDGFNWTYPFATLSGDSDSLRLTCPGRDYTFPKRNIRRLSRHRGLFSIGLRIEYSETSFPTFIVFWASIFFWSSGFERLRAELERLGYDIHSNVA